MYFITRIIIFKGFNGTDDMHYAMLAANMLKGIYNPFASGDIFSGRILLIAWQVLFYKVGGINIITTQVPCFLAALLSCYLTVFKLLKAYDAPLIVIATSLFYFNPVLTYATQGILPDVYVMLAGIITIILWQNSMASASIKKNISNGVGIGCTIAACLFFKETAVIFPILIACLVTMHRTKAAAITCLAIFIILFVVGAVCGYLYYYYTGNAIFRLQQAQNSAYYNPCSYDILPASFLIIRLTYGVWKLFLSIGFYSLLFAIAIVCIQWLSKRKTDALQSNAAGCFIILLAVALYLPFSFTSYQPLCSDSSRHFLFLLPFAVWVCAPYLLNDIEQHTTTKWAVVCSLMLLLCILSTPDKWQWMVWLALIIFFAVTKFYQHRIFNTYKYFAFAATLWLCMPYHLFYGNSNWFGNMRGLNKQLIGNYYYFPEHDNMAHWQLLHGFDDSIHCYNLDATPYSVFKLYYQPLDSTIFNAGWLLVDKAYTVRSDNFIQTIDSLQTMHYFNKQIIIGDMGAYYIDKSTQLAFLKTIVENDEKVLR